MILKGGPVHHLVLDLRLKKTFEHLMLGCVKVPYIEGESSEENIFLEDCSGYFGSVST